MDQQRREAILADITRLVEKKEFSKARVSIKELLAAFPSSRTILTKAINVCRSSKDFGGSLHFSKVLRVTNPDYFDGYARLSQDLVSLRRYHEAVEAIEEGLSKFPDNKWVLFSALRTYKAAYRLDEAIACGDKLASQYLDFEAFHRTYVEVLLISNHLQKAQSFLNLLQDSARKLDMYLDLLLNQRKYGEYQSKLYCAIKDHPSLARDYANRLRDTFITGSSRCQNIKVRKNSADIICIASDEAPYMHEFVHHYLYLGFENVFVGLNNCSDDTKRIIEKISVRYNNVRILDVDHVMKAFKQRGCYAFLFGHAKKHSASEYCLFVDVDEFWVSEPFPRKISDFLSGVESFDCMSFQWINCFDEKHFTPPLSRMHSVRLNNHVKSIVRYDAELISIGAHSPTLANTEFPSAHIGFHLNQNITRGAKGYIVHPISSDDYLPSLDQKGLGWIFHRMNRSEIEFSHRIFKVHANDDSAKISFKSNRRGGYQRNLANGEQEEKFLNRLFDPEAVRLYHSSLEKFKLECDIVDEVDHARSMINEANILETLKSIPPDVFERDFDIILDSFTGTKFHRFVKEGRK